MRGFIVPLLAIIAGFLISLPSEGQTGKRLSPSDLKNIDDITQVAMNAALARDFATWASLFLEDAVINPPNEPAIKGRTAIRAWLEKFPPMTEFKLKNEKVEGSDDFERAELIALISGDGPDAFAVASRAWKRYGRSLL